MFTIEQEYCNFYVTSGTGGLKSNFNFDKKMWSFIVYKVPGICHCFFVTSTQIPNWLIMYLFQNLIAQIDKTENR